MVKHVQLVACLLLLGVLLTACGGGDDPTPVEMLPATTTPGINEKPTDANFPESTSAPTATVTSIATATAGPTSSPTPPPTNTPHPELTPTGIPLPTEGDGSVEEATNDGPANIGTQLVAMLLDVDDLGDNWELFSSGVAGEYPGGLEFCNTPPFDSQGNLLGTVRAEFGQDSQNGPFLLQDIFAYAPEVAPDAFAYIRGVMDECSSWTDAGDSEIFLELADVPALGDESFGIHLTSPISETETIRADFTFVRMGSLLLAFGWLGLDEVDTVRFNEIIQLAVNNVEASDFLP